VPSFSSKTQSQKTVFEHYQNKFGANLHSDFSLAEIDGERRAFEGATKSYESTSEKVFRPMSAFERGRLTYLPMIIPVKEIRLSKDKIILKKGNREHRYKWSDFEDAFITSRAGHKGARPWRGCVPPE
jgi:hypothetical protein